MKWVGFSLLPLLLSACCLEVVSGDSRVVERSTASNNDAGRGRGSGGAQHCSYPSSSTPVSTFLFPDQELGVGWLNFSGELDSAATIGPAADALLELHCSGERYVLVGITGILDSIPETAPAIDQLTQEASGWLDLGGLVLIVLEKTRSVAATQQDLLDWAAEHPTRVSVVSDPGQGLLGALGAEVGVGAPVEWPAFYVIRLSDMASEGVIYDDESEMPGFYSDLLAGKFDGGV